MQAVGDDGALHKSEGLKHAVEALHRASFEFAGQTRAVVSSTVTFNGS
jgi:ribosomal protein L16/L10AE